MCTLMEKDVLIELVAGTLATLGLRVVNPTDGNDEQKTLGKLRNYLYSIHPEEINFKEVLTEIQSIEAKYKDLPLLPQFAAKQELLEDYDIKKDVEDKWEIVWQSLHFSKEITPVESPTITLLGGQPGAGKSFGAGLITERLGGNVIVINGDEFRNYHKYFAELNATLGKDSVKETGKFAGEMVQRIRDEALKRRYNIIIEGTFGTTQVPMVELERFKSKGYATGIVICTCPKAVSWQSTIERGNVQEATGNIGRYVPQDHYEKVVNSLAANIAYVYQNGKPDFLEVYARGKKLFDSRSNLAEQLQQCIEHELNKL